MPIRTPYNTRARAKPPNSGVSMKRLLSVLLLLAAAILLFYFTWNPERNAQPIAGLPWQIEVLPDGSSEVFGLTLSRSTLADARARHGEDMELALMSAQDGKVSLEAYYGDFILGVLMGKMILGTALDAQTVADLQRRAIKMERLESGGQKYTLHPDDLPLAYAAPIDTITFIPSANFDEALVLQRFGMPGERIRSDEQLEHFLYPDKGLDVILNDDGKEVLQYVAPRDFERLRAPLSAGRETP